MKTKKKQSLEAELEACMDMKCLQLQFLGLCLSTILSSHQELVFHVLIIGGLAGLQV